MNMQGILEGDLQILFTRIHFGKKDGRDFAQLSFPDLGDMNNEVKYINISEDTISIIFDLNGFDMNINVKNSNNDWIGKMDLNSIDLHVDFKMNYISDISDFQEHHYIMNEKHVNLLKNNHKYDSYECESVFKYELNNQEVFNYIRSIGINVENNHDLDTVVKLIKKTCEIIHHDGGNYIHDRENKGTIAQIEYANKQNGFTNCRGLAIIMQGVLRAYGFKANLVECWPDQSNVSDIHVVCEVYVDDLKKTILLDPSNNLIYYKNGVPVNLFELITVIVNNEIETLTINEDAAHNNEKVDLIQMLSYMSKNLVYLNKGINSNETLELSENSICLSSKTLLNQSYPEAAIYTSNVKQFYL